MKVRHIAPLVLAVVLPLASLGAQDQHEHPAGRLGAVQFATSCSPEVQQELDRGVALLHSFWFSAAIEAFNGVLKSDPKCTMAHWGIAMSWWGNPFGGFRSPQAIAAGLASIDQGKAAGGGTEREREYLAAIEAKKRGTQSDRIRNLIGANKATI